MRKSSGKFVCKCITVSVIMMGMCKEIVEYKKIFEQENKRFFSSLFYHYFKRNEVKQWSFTIFYIS